MKNKLPLGALIYGIIGLLLVILGFINKSDTIFTLEFVFGLIALLTGLHYLDSFKIKILEKRIKQLENK